MKEKREIVREIISERGRGRESIRGIERERKSEHFFIKLFVKFLISFLIIQM